MDIKTSRKTSTKGMWGGCKEKAGKSISKIGGEKARKIKDDMGTQKRSTGFPKWKQRPPYL